ncbi:hypothetical protein GOB43_14030 [Sinorhizobium meliloti]|uniref:hypothetical protein n=1 Tax=Rhizobium meliloti TaxID=382 RepID=UPI000FDBB725|nr:hypothetical protein [Sinorhizobium meliloti]MDW9409080.1 hypothetical protein [Sinorhizobium meliloti]MDW9454236.1 hypothetical protein [Sinorhizobium meliloti]MDW9466885.1 hypothetical protein [Sinorhizobium meliloti]MDW9518403.1 hypothetical protein [Sinorhizobium meliloti]MDW9555958.1 hypothetical protein [Sinorhizobium meliloti]
MIDLSWLWSWLPEMDGGTVFSTVLGLAATFATFYVAYRKTEGAREERLRATNLELVASVFRRIAVERESLPLGHFSAMRKAKGYKAQIDANQLSGYSDVLDLVTCEAIENQFLDKAAKADVLKIIEESGRSAQPEKPINGADKRRKKWLVAVLASFSIAVGVATTWFAQAFIVVEVPASAKSTTVEMMLTIAALGAALFALIDALRTMRRATTSARILRDSVEKTASNEPEHK